MLGGHLENCTQKGYAYGYLKSARECFEKKQAHLNSLCDPCAQVMCTQVPDDIQKDTDASSTFNTDDPCGRPRNPCDSIDISKVPSYDRLRIKKKTRIDLMRERMGTPKGAVPSTSLVSWRYGPIDRKIPGYRDGEGCIYYSRGKLGEKLNRSTSIYTLADPKNQERSVAEPYTSLHDPHTKRFMRQPHVKNFLCQQGLINENDEVLCSLKQFNDYRGYLRSQCNDELLSQLGSQDRCDIFYRKQLQKVQQSMKPSCSKNDRLYRIGQQKQLEMENKIKCFESKQIIRDCKMQRLSNNKTNYRLNNFIHGLEKEQLRQEKLEKILEYRIEQRRCLMRQILMRNYEWGERVRRQRVCTTRAFQQACMDNLEQRYMRDRYTFRRDTKLEQCMRKVRKKQAQKRQKKIEKMREMRPVLDMKKAEDARRLLELVRRCFQQWRDMTLKKMAEKQSAQSDRTTIWTHGMEQTTKDLKRKAGCGVKMEEFVFSLMKLKQSQIGIEGDMTDRSNNADEQNKSNYSTTRSSKGASKPVSAPASRMSKKTKNLRDDFYTNSELDLQTTEELRKDIIYDLCGEDNLEIPCHGHLRQKLSRKSSGTLNRPKTSIPKGEKQPECMKPKKRSTVETTESERKLKRPSKVKCQSQEDTKRKSDEKPAKAVKKAERGSTEYEEEDELIDKSLEDVRKSQTKTAPTDTGPSQPSHRVVRISSEQKVGSNPTILTDEDYAALLLLPKCEYEEECVALPSEESTDSADDMIDLIIDEEKRKLEHEIKILDSESYEKLGEILSDDNLSRISSEITKRAVCRQLMKAEKLKKICQDSLTPTPSEIDLAERELYDDCQSQSDEDSEEPEEPFKPFISYSKHDSSKHAKIHSSSYYKEFMDCGGKIQCCDSKWNNEGRHSKKSKGSDQTRRLKDSGNDERKDGDNGSGSSSSKSSMKSLSKKATVASAKVVLIDPDFQDDSEDNIVVEPTFARDHTIPVPIESSAAGLMIKKASASSSINGDVIKSASSGELGMGNVNDTPAPSGLGKPTLAGRRSNSKEGIRESSSADTEKEVEVLHVHKPKQTKQEQLNEVQTKIDAVKSELTAIGIMQRSSESNP